VGNGNRAGLPPPWATVVLEGEGTRQGPQARAALEVSARGTPGRSVHLLDRTRVNCYTRSMIMAGAMPPAAHIVTRPRRRSRRSSSSSSVPIRTEPVAPIGRTRANYIRLLAPLESPGIIAAIVDGTAPANLTVTGFAKALPRSWAPQAGLRHTSNRSRACRNGNWKMASRDWRRRKATSPHLTFHICRPETPARQPNAREYPRFSHARILHRRDRTGWLGMQDSNRQM